MVYITSCDDFVERSVQLFRADPEKTRYVMKYRHSEGKLFLKVTDDTECIKFRTDQPQDAKKMEKLKCEKVSDSNRLNCTNKIIIDLAVPSESAIKVPDVGSSAISSVSANFFGVCLKNCKPAVLREILEKFLPDDAHIRCNGRVRVAVTQILWRLRGLLVDQFESKEDLINAVFTSSFIPGYLAPRPATLFRNKLCIDGGLTLFMPPTSAAQTVTSEEIN